jgi:hypothetical protein
MWEKPKTDWKPGDGIKAVDLNRIEGNTETLLRGVYDIGGSFIYIEENLRDPLQKVLASRLVVLSPNTRLVPIYLQNPFPPNILRVYVNAAEKFSTTEEFVEFTTNTASVLAANNSSSENLRVRVLIMGLPPYIRYSASSTSTQYRWRYNGLVNCYMRMAAIDGAEREKDTNVWQA